MKEFIDKLIGRLEELKKREMDREENITEDGYWEDCEEAFEDGESNGMYTAYTRAIQIVNQLSEEYNNGFCEWKSEKDMFIQNPHTGRMFSNEPSMRNVYCNTCGKKIKTLWR